jgi:ATP-dependent Lhr-like helicase
VRDPAGDLVLRYARTHGPFTTDECARRFALGQAIAEEVLGRIASAGRLLAGEFRPGGIHREWCETGVLRTLRQRSLARLRREVEPVETDALGRLTTMWQGVVRPRAGLDALLDVIEQLQGAPVPVSVLEPEVLPARVEGYRPGDLDLLMGAGEVVWLGVEPLGERDGRIALYLTDHLRALVPPTEPAERTGLPAAILEHLQTAGASFFPAIHAACGGGFPQDVVDALWDLVWAGVVTNDTFHAIRAFVAPPARTRRDRQTRDYRSRRAAPPAAQGRWSLVAPRIGERPSSTEWATGIARQLLNRHGILTREAVAAEGLRGGFSTVYEVLKTMEESGRIRRGLFVGGLGAMQFALPAALDLLRSVRDEPESAQVTHLAATDPANPYGAILKWPIASGAPREGRGPTRTAGATVILVNGRLAAYLSRGDRQVWVYLPDEEPTRTNTARAVASRLFQLATAAEGRRGMLIAQLDGVDIGEHALAPYLVEAGFVRGAMGFQASRRQPAASSQ